MLRYSVTSILFLGDLDQNILEPKQVSLTSTDRITELDPEKESRAIVTRVISFCDPLSQKSVFFFF